MSKTKVCSQCGRELPATAEYFWRLRRVKCGLTPVCKECNREKYISTKIKPRDGYKICSKCKRELPATAEYYHRQSANSYGLTAACKECSKKQRDDRRARIASAKIKPQVREGYKICSKCKQELPATNEFFAIARRNTGGLKCVCKQCSRIETKAYKTKHREEISIKARIYKEKHKEEIRAKSKAYRDKHRVIKEEPLVKEKTCRKCGNVYPANDDTYFFKKDTGKYGLGTLCKKCSRERSKKYNLENKEHMNDVKRAYYRKNLEKFKEYSREFHKEYGKTAKGKAVRAAYYNRRRSNETNVDNSLTSTQWMSIQEAFEGKCCYCGKKTKLTVEHFIPVSESGETNINNILPACLSCNSSKNNRDFFAWYPSQPFYSKRREKAVLDFLGYDSETQQISMF